ncbi:hypothetical protein [Pseudomonas sp. B33.4]|uniref:hypothetical protein n=1 Tax=Pseudomonas sp. B33.4 TaxID=3104265 RepID=UPI002ADEDCFE|nr:hypothetical protein [Pseudomonas sp. B33.4]
MVKPPKTTTHSISSEIASRVDSDSVSSNRVLPSNIDTPAPASHRLPDTPNPAEPQLDAINEPHVVMSYITDPIITQANARLAEITLPGLQTHLLKPHESVDGLYINVDGQTYAQLEEGGHYRVEPNSAGEYQIPWPVAPGVTPPIVKKVQGQAHWRIEAPWYVAQAAQVNLSMSLMNAEQPHAAIFIDPNLATLLPAANQSRDGIRQGPRGKIYVDIANGTIMVRRNDQGEYKLASATTTKVPDITVEQIPGQFVWRRKSQPFTGTQQDPQPGSSRALGQAEDSGPGPTKRARLPADSALLTPDVPVRHNDEWKTWGSATKPLVGDSIEIDAQHFPVLPQPNLAGDSLAFIKPPQFSSLRFDAFEHMMLTSPELQPRGVVKLAEPWAGHTGDTWRIIDGLPFSKCLTQYVSDQFPYLAYHSANKVAREIFNRANYAEELNGPGTHALFETIKYWEKRATSIDEKRTVRQDLSDPLMLLTPLPVDVNGYIHMPPPSADGLQRIDFNPQLFFGSRHQVNRQSARDLFIGILGGHGYRVSRNFRHIAGDALLIQRTGVDTVFIMFLDKLHYDTTVSTDPTIWLKKRALINKIEPSHKILLQDHLAIDKIIYLAGNNKPLPSGENNLIITRIK